MRDGEDEAILSMEEFERRARRGELSPHALVSIPPLTGDGFVEARSLPMFAAVYDPRRLLFRRHFHLGRLPIVTGAIALVCLAMWLVAKDLGDGTVTREALLALGAKSRARIVDEGETWRLVVASLLHKDGVHLGFNLFVLLAVGAVLEGVYRRGDYLLLLVLSGLSCMVVSTVASPPATVGASGMVFGCLGCAMVFGLRFADVLPLRYRLYFGVVLVVYTAAAFWTGLLRTSTDNWGHAGGLLCGAVCALVLEPRLLRLTDVAESRAVMLRPWLLVVVTVVTVVAVGPLVPRLLLSFEPLRFGAFGVTLEHPGTWSRGPDPLGFVAVGNGTDALASLACSKASMPAATDVVSRRFVDNELFGLSRAGHIAQLEVDADAEDTIAGVPARRVGFSFMASDGPFLARAWVFVRGDLECVLVAAHRREASAKARALLDELVARLRVGPTDAELNAITATERQPTSTKAWLERALTHQSAGAVDDARRAFDEAATHASTEPGWLARVNIARARFELALPPTTAHLDDARRAAVAATGAAPDNADAAAALVDVDLVRGALDDACATTRLARHRFRDDRRFVTSPSCP